MFALLSSDQQDKKSIYEDVMEGKELRDVLGKNLKLFRSRRNWSQADLAEHTGISLTFLGDIERGKKWPYPDTLTNLARALDIEVHELFRMEARRSNETSKELMSRFIRDASFTINKSLSRSLSQSLEHLRKQYEEDREDQDEVL
jgi:transcriptional regulator with XRE-family HTH domain